METGECVDDVVRAPQTSNGSCGSVEYRLEAVWYYRTAPSLNVSPGGSVPVQSPPRRNLARYKVCYTFSPVVIDSPPPLHSLSPMTKSPLSYAISVT